jgi:hypothetical protein
VVADDFLSRVSLVFSVGDSADSSALAVAAAFSAAFAASLIDTDVLDVTVVGCIGCFLPWAVALEAVLVACANTLGLYLEIECFIFIPSIFSMASYSQAAEIVPEPTIHW